MAQKWQTLVILAVLVGWAGCAARHGLGTQLDFCETLTAKDFKRAATALREEVEASRTEASSTEAAEIASIATAIEAQTCVTEVSVSTAVIRTEPPIRKIFFEMIDPVRTCHVEVTLAPPYRLGPIKCHDRADKMPRPPMR